MTNFEKLVAQMRAAQIRYFKLPAGTEEKRAVLKQSIALEKKVDELLNQKETAATRMEVGDAQ